MKTTLTAVLIGVGACLALFGFIDQAQALDAPGPGKTEGPAAKGLTLYKPPLLGAPKLRVGGGVRGAGSDDSPVLQVLAPAQTGQTTVAQPVLYWYLDKSTTHAMEITIMEEGGVAPLVRAELAGPVAAGLHAFRLASQDKRLAIGKEYEWFVAVMLDPAQRSKDILAGGGVRRVALPPGLEGQVKAAKGDELGLLYAGSGLWYDAIHAMVAGQNKAADKAALSSQFTAILKQEEISGIGLTSPVEIP